MTESRVEQWKRRLLDLSLRNPLLNARDCSRFLPLNARVPYGCWAKTAKIPTDALVEPGGVVPFRAELPEKETCRRLKELCLRSRSLFNESGVNSLYLAVGFLNWHGRDGEPFRQAPLILIPAQIVRQTASPGYRLVRTEDDAVVNFCLLEMMRSQFGIMIHDAAGGGMGDGDPDFSEVIACFDESIRARKDWSISTGSALGIFSFSKVVIWKDLVDHFEHFRRHPLVRHFAEGTGLYDDGVKIFPPADVGAHLNPDRLFCPMNADSSQLTAVLYSELGKSFVLHGPPGTGKSQTITNIIAHNLALGKRILFVSEKRAALDVVHRRLSAVGLTPFCMELHSNKADKANVMRQFKEALDGTPVPSPSQWSPTCARVAASIAELGRYAKELHSPCANGLSAYDCLVRRVQKHPYAEASLVSLNVADASRESLDAAKEVIRSVAEEWNGVDRTDYDALRIVCAKDDWSPEYEERVRVDAVALLKALSETNTVMRVLKVLWRGVASAFRRTIMYPLCAGTMDDCRAQIQAVKDHLDGLRLVMSYRLNRRRAVKAKCRKLLELLEEGLFTSDEAVRVFDDSCSEKSLNTLISRSRVLSGFSGVRQDERIAHFREVDKAYTVMSREKIASILSKRRDEIEHPPAVKDKDGNVVVPKVDAELKRQMAVLKRECEKKKRFMPPRKLLSDANELTMRLKPCFLMSPLSVAQYLPADCGLFDMVIFDEASQMTIGDAIGVIARGRQLVVVGDPKQLPPTNFFVKGDLDYGGGEEYSTTEDLESVLDECLANGLYSAHLNWHYRSRHEGLIAFSNRNYYGDLLNTFPAAAMNGRLGVSFQLVARASYDHATHTNRREAEAIVDFLFARLSDPSERRRSWGVVAFSVAQQRLIEEIIEKRREGLDWAADFFDSAKPDAFFVKNLESVQGDERDVIMFSIAYAPDDKGRFAMSFGPINRMGGERRLNVAITRAKESVVVFASVHGADIRAERTDSVGVKHLKALMIYAETGRLEGDSEQTSNKRADGVVGDVRDFLESKGYVVEENFGRSTMPIELAVRHPNAANRHLLAIEFDGPMYASQKTVRDRDVLRPAILENLGWKHFRLWSMDWVFDRKRVRQRLLDALEGSARDCGSID